MPTGKRRGFTRILMAIAVASVSTASACGDGEVDAIETQRAEPLSVAFLGDSYTIPFNGPSYWETAASRMCWQATAVGAPGSGYVSMGVDNLGPYISRIDAVVAARPDVVIVQGSFNDTEPALVRPAAEYLFRELHQRLPAARIVAMGPVTPLTPARAALVPAVSEAVRQAALANWTVFVDARRLLPDPALFEADEFHPNVRGHEVLGTALADELPSELKSCE